MSEVLTSIVSEIRALHVGILEHASESIHMGIKIGELLTTQKEKLKHGEWLPWIEHNMPFAERTARNYIRLYNERESLLRHQIADLTEAYKWLVEPNLPEIPFKTNPDPVEKSVPSAPAKVPQKSKPKPAEVEAQAVADIRQAQGNIGVVDELGYPIPANHVPLWDRRQEVQDLLTQLTRIKTALEQYRANNDILFREVALQGIISELQHVRYCVKMARPYVVCLNCQGRNSDDCDACKGRGMISEFRYSSIDSKLKAMRAKMIAGRKK